MTTTFASRALFPWALIFLRLAIGPALMWNAIAESSTALIPIGMTAAFLSDIFDGVLARRWFVATPRLRRADSTVDVIFYTCVAFTVRLTRPELWAGWWPMLDGFLAIEAVVQLIHFTRFGRPAAVHAYSSKAWGIVLFVVATLLLMRTGTDALCWVVLCGGTIAYAELLLIVAKSPALPIDVRTVFDLRTSQRQRDDVTAAIEPAFAVQSTPRDPSDQTAAA